MYLKSINFCVIIKRIVAINLYLVIVIAFIGCRGLNLNQFDTDFAENISEEVENVLSDIEEAMDNIDIKDTIIFGEQEAVSPNEPSLLGWEYPLSDGHKIYQNFGALYSGYHLGTDISLPGKNVEVYAIYKGTVIESALKGDNGEIVVIEHDISGKLFYSSYSHLEEGSQTVSKNDLVNAGSKIGIMGNTGKSSGAHLHIAIYSGRQTLDPFGYTNKKDEGYDDKGYIDYNNIRFYDPILVIETNGNTILENYY